MGDYDFHEKLKRSMEHLPRVREVLRRRLGAIEVKVASEEDDRAGVDYWATLTSGQPVGVDLKVRDHEFGDLIIETVSNTATMQVGWTLDPTKRTDFVLYLWPETEQLVSYPQLRAAALENLERWTTMYPPGRSTSNNGSWGTRWLAVPDEEVLAAMHYRRSRPRLVEPSGPRCPGCGGPPSETQTSLDVSILRHRCGRCRKWWEAAA